MNIDVMYAGNAELAEGPVWFDNHLFWVNIVEGTLNKLNPTTGENVAKSVGRMLGAAVPAETDQEWILATHDGFAMFNWKTEAFVPVIHPERHIPRHRFNDGKCDPAGRFWAGTLNLDDQRGRCALYVLTEQLHVRTMLSGVDLSNGLAWAPDGQTFYYIDTLTQAIQAFDFDLAAGALSRRRVLADTRAERGFPDGMCIDVDGNLWVAMWGGDVLCFDGRTGRVRERIAVPVSQPSSCTFGGEHLDELYITSAWQGMTAEQRARDPLAGAIFRCKPGVRGAPPILFRQAVQRIPI